jgi:hypothetical protein
MPRLGQEVTIEYLAGTARATVRRIEDGGRRLEVLTEDGATVTFALNRATATFTAGGEQTGARLRF